MLIKINQLNDTCYDLEREVDDLKGRIREMLKAEKREIQYGEERHNDDLKDIIDAN